MSKKMIGVCGHFDGAKPTSSGQIIKTRIVTEQLIRQYGTNQVLVVDTHGGAKALPRVMLESWNLFKQCKNIIIMPAHNGLRIFCPLFTFYNKFFHRSIHYIVIGGWLNGFIEHHKWLIGMLKKFKGIYVETLSMKKSLAEHGFNNAVLMPNFKNLKILRPEELSCVDKKPYKLCTFSRVCKEKGIEDAIKAVSIVNNDNNNVIFALDIYGQIDEEYKDYFKRIQEHFPPYIKYCGLVPYNKSVDVLKDYFALLFPTFYSGEGVAGTLIDAMAAGVPVIASDWRFNNEVIRPGINGCLIEKCNSEKIASELERIIKEPEKWNEMKYSCLLEAQKYIPRIAIKSLTSRL